MFGSLRGLVCVLFACRGAAEAYQKFENCNNAIVEVSYLDVTCDANRTYYYGSGVHRSSATCDDDDKATITVDFDVAEDLPEDNDIYVKLSAYTENYEKVYGSSPKSLSDYVGYECNTQGSYSFTTKVQFESVGGYDVDFVPLVKMAFSIDTSGRSDLGGINLNQCDSDPSSLEGKLSESQRRRIAIICGVTVTVLAVIAGLVLTISRRTKESKSAEAPRKKPILRMSESDYGVVLNDSGAWSEPSNSTPFLPPDKSTSEDHNAPRPRDEEAADQPQRAWDSDRPDPASTHLTEADKPNTVPVTESRPASEEPNQGMKRGPSLVRFLMRKRTKAPKN